MVGAPQARNWGGGNRYEVTESDSGILLEVWPGRVVSIIIIIKIVTIILITCEVVRSLLCICSM